MGAHLRFSPGTTIFFSPKSLGLRQGGKQADPDELTQVSDSGEIAQSTQLQRQIIRGYTAKDW